VTEGAPLPEAGALVAGLYVIDGPLGEGAMGAIFRARTQTTGRPVAIKFLHPDHARDGESLARFHQEAHVATSIGHPGIVEVLDVGVNEQGAPFLVMELLEGQSFAALRRPHEQLGVGLVAYVACSVLSALGAAHRAGVVHRDLKPENVFLVDRAGAMPAVKLLDFGISRVLKVEQGPPVRLTQTGTILGTPFYMSPEQAQGQGDVDHRADLYAMGVMLYEALTGQLPIEAKNYNRLLVAVLTETPV